MVPVIQRDVAGAVVPGLRSVGQHSRLQKHPQTSSPPVPDVARMKDVSASFSSKVTTSVNDHAFRGFHDVFTLGHSALGVLLLVIGKMCDVLCK